MELPSSLVASQIERGSIFHSTIFEDIDHGKFFIIIGVSEDEVAGFFFINSNIPRFMQDKPEQLALQYPLRHRLYNFLRYDSFVEASELIVKKKSGILKSINEGITEFKGCLGSEDLENILAMVRVSKVFSKRDKKRFFL